MLKKRIQLIFMGLLLCAGVAQAFETFTVKKIEVLGIQRITRGAVLNYLPVRLGDRVVFSDTAAMIRGLYQTGFFTDVAIKQRGSVLVVKVQERPTIGRVHVSGNKTIPKAKFDQVLHDLNVTEGRVYNPAVLDNVTQELKSVYNTLGKYNSRVQVSTKPLPRNRVVLHIDITEGKIAKISDINLIGNHAFNHRALLKQLPISTASLLTFFTHSNEYTQEKLRAAQAALTSFYMDRGFVKMKLVSTQVSITPDRSKVYITIKINENGRYRFSGYQLSGKLILPKAELAKRVTIKAGAVFSRAQIVSSMNALGDALGEVGYGFPLINPVLQFNEKQHTVWVNIMLKPGTKVYVRRVKFSGNTRTADTVLRHAIRQHEGQLLSLSKIKESERQLRILPYLKNVRVQTHAVSGTNNQVDLNYHVEEANSAQFNLQLGFSTAEKFLVSAAVTEPNFLGSGRNVSLKFSNSRLTRSVAFNYFNPYYAEFGLGRGFNLYYERNTPDRLNTISPYNNNRYGGALTYRYLLDDHDSFQWGAGFEHLVLTHVSADISQYVAFVDGYGTRFNQFRLTSSWDHNSYNKFPFPTQGNRSQFVTLLSLPAGNGLKYYKLSYVGRIYQPLFRGLLLSLRTGLVFGNGFAGTKGLPFFENSFAGGVGSIGQARGYETFSLGPRDSTSRSRPLGGNMLMSSSASIIFPYPLSRESFRSSVFVDVANVYAYQLPESFRGTRSGAVRLSAGLGVTWQSPFGPLQFSLAWPLNHQPNDRKEPFQFSIASGL
jgi:outer membrane protein insertion porin family